MGHFDAAIPFRINRKFSSNLLSRANVLKPELILEQEKVKIGFRIDQSHDGEMRKTVKLRNDQNSPIEFRWSPLVDEDLGQGSKLVHFSLTNYHKALKLN